MNYFKILAATVTVLFTIANISMPDVQAEEAEATEVVEEIIEEPVEVEDVAIEVEEELQDEDGPETEDKPEPEDEPKAEELISEEFQESSLLHIEIYQDVEMFDHDGNKYIETLLTTEMSIGTELSPTKDLLNRAFSSFDDSKMYLGAIYENELPEICPEELSINIHQDVDGRIQQIQVTEVTDDK